MLGLETGQVAALNRVVREGGTEKVIFRQTHRMKKLNQWMPGEEYSRQRVQVQGSWGRSVAGAG